VEEEGRETREGRLAKGRVKLKVDRKAWEGN
jgi:hypothetical protein